MYNYIKKEELFLFFYIFNAIYIIFSLIDYNENNYRPISSKKIFKNKKRLTKPYKSNNINGRGIRIRTRTKGFGDPRATVDTMPLCHT